LGDRVGFRSIAVSRQERVAHTSVAFLSYSLSVTLKQELQALAPGLTPRAVLEKLARVPELILKNEIREHCSVLIR
jgi:hypothetical protein